MPLTSANTRRSALPGGCAVPSDAKEAGDLGIGVAGCEQAQQVPVPGGELGDRVAAAFGVEIGLVQVRAQQHQQCLVTLGEIATRPTEKNSRRVRPGAETGLGAAGGVSIRSCSFPHGRYMS
jgi:hypothetical protein